MGNDLIIGCFYTGNAREVAVGIKMSVVSGAGDEDLLDIYEEVKQQSNCLYYVIKIISKL